MTQFDISQLSEAERRKIAMEENVRLRNANLAKARAKRAANVAAAKQNAAAMAAQAPASPDPPAAPQAGEAGGLGVSAARRAQAAIPGTVVGRNERGRVIVIGRDGKPVSRQGDNQVDKFDVKKYCAAGWTFQWIAEEVLNQPQTAAMNEFYQGGWTPVPQEKIPGIPVLQGGLRLVERPLPLTEEARQEEMQQANDQLATNVKQFMPHDAAARAAGLKPIGGIRKSRAIAVDEVPPPHVEIAAD